MDRALKYLKLEIEIQVSSISECFWEKFLLDNFVLRFNKILKRKFKFLTVFIFSTLFTFVVDVRIGRSELTRSIVEKCDLSCSISCNHKSYCTFC